MRSANEVVRVESRGRRYCEVGVFLLCAVALGSVVGITLGTTRAGHRAPDPAVAAVEVVVMPGDTLWSIARRHVSKEVDLRAAVDDIIALNRLCSTTLRPGQVLLVQVEIDDDGDDGSPSADTLAAAQ
ncbi:MAG: LysM peptidoglycan-binding domain-containing protein [Bacillota bacterium]